MAKVKIDVCCSTCAHERLGVNTIRQGIWCTKDRKEFRENSNVAYCECWNASRHALGFAINRDDPKPAASCTYPGRVI